MGEETLGFSTMDDLVKMPSSLEDFEMDLEDLLRETQQQRRSRAAATLERERELNIIRSGSAPPTVEGARTAIGSLFGDPDFAGFNLADGYDPRGMLSEENITSHPSYLRYYGSNEESNPRLPLPAALSKEDWLIARRFQAGASTFGGIGDRRSSLGGETANGGGGLLFSPQPGLPPRAAGSEQAKMRMGLQRSYYRPSPSEWGELENDDLIAPTAMGLSARKSFSDALQKEHARNSSSVIQHHTHLLGRGPFENVISPGGLETMENMNMRTLSPSLVRAQSFTSSVSNSSNSFGTPVPRSITPDPQIIGRRSEIRSNGPPGIMADPHDLAAALSAMNLNSSREQAFDEYLYHQSMTKPDVDPLSFLKMNPKRQFGLQNGLGSSANFPVNTGDRSRKYVDPLLVQYLQGNDASVLDKLQYGMMPSVGKTDGFLPFDLGGIQYPAEGSLRQGERLPRYPASTRRSPNGLAAPWNPDNGPVVGGFGSSLLEEFKSNKTRSFELAEIVGHVVEFSADQHGSRFIQQKLEVASDDEKNMIFSEIIPHARALMTDVFGNYVIQKFFEHGTERQRKQLAGQVIGHVLQLSLQMYGCRVIQKALEVVDVDQQTQMVSELDGSVMKCVRDQNGNHVVQKCIECVPQDRIQFIVSSFYGQVVPLSTHPYGCRVIQRVLEHCNDSKTQSIMMDEILHAVTPLTQDQYGNYVIQHVLQHGKPEERTAIIVKLSGQIVKMSQQKFASNVIEKCLTFGTPEERQLLINEILGPNDENEPLQAMMKDQFGNYVVQKVLETCDDKNRELILSRIKAHVSSLKKYTYGKHIAARVEKVIAAGERRMLMSSNAS